MRLIIVLLLLTNMVPAFSQTGGFPDNWTGNWQGELLWFKTGVDTPQRVKMELRIQPADTAGQYSWQLVYGKPGEDSRPYLLRPAEQAKGHWVIDEKNGIVLDQFWVGNRLCGVFTVMNSTIVNSYRMEGNQLIVEFQSFAARPVGTSGKGDADIPLVDSYRVTGFQRAILSRQ